MPQKKSKKRITKRRVTYTTTKKLGGPKKNGGIKSAKKRSRNAYLDMLSNPMAADTAACPDGYTAQTSVFSLQNNGIPWATGAASTLSNLVVNPWSLGRSRERACMGMDQYQLQQNPSGQFIAPNSRVGTQPVVQYFASPTDMAKLATVPNLALTGLSASNVGDFVLLAESAASVASSVFETPAPVYFTGVGKGSGSTYLTGTNPVIAVYDRARPLCASVKFTYIGPHGDGQRGVLFLNSAMLGPPANGVSHFKTLAELKAHPDTVQVRVGADFQVNLYPASDVARGFTPLSAWRSPWGTCISESTLGVADGTQSVICLDSSSGVATAYTTALMQTVDAAGIYPADAYVTYSSGVPTHSAKQPLSLYATLASTTTRTAVVNAVPLTGELEDIDAKVGEEFGVNPFYSPAVAIATESVLSSSAPVMVAGSDPSSLAASNVRDIASTSALGQWPLLYCVMEGVPVGTTAYDLKVKTHFEAIPQPSVASFIASTDVKADPRTVEAGQKMMEFRGDLNQAVADTISYTAAFGVVGALMNGMNRLRGR